MGSAAHREIFAEECEKRGLTVKAANVRAAATSSIVEDSDATRAALAAMARIEIPAAARDQAIEAICDKIELKFDVDGNDSAAEVDRWVFGRDICKELRALKAPVAP